jgi:hypothetical protein
MLLMVHIEPPNGQKFPEPRAALDCRDDEPLQAQASTASERTGSLKERLFFLRRESTSLASPLMAHPWATKFVT